MEFVNKSARFNYFVIDEYEAGIVLTGTEIKSVRNGSCNIKDSYGIIRKGEVYLLKKVYFKDSKLKVLIGVCRGKKTFDKRETIKERDIKRDVERNLKKYS